MPNVLKNGKLVKIEDQYKGKAGNRYLFVAPVSVVDKNGNNLDYFAEVIVREGISKDNNGKRRLYIHEVELKNKLADVFTTSYNTSTPASSKSIISKLINKINSDGKFYQKAYVSMKGDLAGDCLGADSFEMSVEGAMVHGWGNYLLKDRKTNKVRYYVENVKWHYPSVFVVNN